MKLNFARNIFLTMYDIFKECDRTFVRYHFYFYVNGEKFNLIYSKRQFSIDIIIFDGYYYFVYKYALMKKKIPMVIPAK